MALVLLILILITQVILIALVQHGRKKIESNQAAALILGRSRVGTISMGRQSHQNPKIDFDPVTTRRDTEDLPRSGRESRVRTARKGGDLRASNPDDGGFSNDPGTPPA